MGHGARGQDRGQAAGVAAPVPPRAGLLVPQALLDLHEAAAGRHRLQRLETIRQAGL